MCVVHPNLGVTSTKRCHMPAAFILLKCYNPQQTCCHHLLLNLTGSHLGSIFFGFEFIKNSLQNNIPLHIPSRGKYNNVHEIIYNCRHYIFVLQRKQHFLVVVYHTSNISILGFSFQIIRTKKSQTGKTNIPKLTCWFLTQSICLFSGKQSIHKSILRISIYESSTSHQQFEL